MNDGAVLSVLDIGPRRQNRSTLVFLHGWAMSRACWGALLERQAARRRVVAIDFRSHGLSPSCAYGHRTDRYACDVRAVMDQLDIQQPVLIGWSMGASVMFSYLDHYTDEDVVGVVAVDQTPKIVSDETWEFGALGIDAAGVEQTAAAIRADYAGSLSEFIPGMFASGVSDEDLQRYSAIAQSLDADAAAALLRDHALCDWRDVIARIVKPILAVSGAQYAAAKGAAGIQYLAPHAQTAVFQESAHCCFLEEAEKFEMLLDDFVSGIERELS